MLASQLVRASRAASAVSYCRVACSIAALITISKTWSSLRLDALAASESSSVTLQACLNLVDQRTRWSGEALLLSAALGTQPRSLALEKELRDQLYEAWRRCAYDLAEVGVLNLSVY
jgi:hypothetical protein